MKIAIIITEPNIEDKEFFHSLYINFIRGYGLFEFVEYQIYNAVNLEFPSNVDEFDGYLITGSSANSYDDDEWIVKLRNHLKELDKKEKRIVGICFGHQILAHSLGGRVGKSTLGWELGQVSVNLNKEGKEIIKHIISLDKIKGNNNNNNNSIVDGASGTTITTNKSDLSAVTSFDSNLDSLQVLQIHQDIVEIIPDDFIVIGSSDKTISQLAIKRSPSDPFKYHLLTFQGHPEFTVGYLTNLINTENAPETLKKDSIDTITNNPDQLFMSKLSFNFFFNQ